MQTDVTGDATETWSTPTSLETTYGCHTCPEGFVTVLQYLYKMKVRYGVVHVDLGPLFTVSRLHLQMLWNELVETCRAQRCHRAIVERASRFQDLRASVSSMQGDLLCGFDVDGVRAAFCLYNECCDDHLAEFAAVAVTLGCTVQRFGGVEAAIGWIGLGQAEESHASQAAGVVQMAEGKPGARGPREASLTPDQDSPRAIPA